MRTGTLPRGSREGFQHSTITLSLGILFALAVLGIATGCAPPKPKLERGYAWAKIQLEIKPGKRFRINFDPSTPWAQFGPLEGETSEFGSMLALYPKTLNGMAEEQITQDAFRRASQQGVQVDLMAVGILMRNVKLDIEKDGEVLRVTDPAPNDKDKHPLAGAVFSGAL
jgi:hypothetical protein